MTLMPQRLLGYFSEDFTDGDVAMLRALVDELSRKHTWHLGAPEFVDDIDDSSCTAPEDQPIRTVGIVLTVSASNENPQTPVDDPARLVAALARFSSERGTEFELEFDGESIGEIKNGQVSRSIKEGLLDTW